MEDFQAVLEAHRKRYPLMEPADFGKLAYQSEYGPEHLVTDEAAAARAIADEMNSLPADGGSHAPESIGNGLCRYHFDQKDDAAVLAPILARLFCMTAQRHTGTRDGLERRLSLLEQADVPGMKEWLADYRNAGCPPVRHSRTYREAYHPHYRLLRAEYALYLPDLRKLRVQLTAKGGPIPAAIDSRCSCGDARLAELAAQVFSDNPYYSDGNFTGWRKP